MSSSHPVRAIHSYPTRALTTCPLYLARKGTNIHAVMNATAMARRSRVAITLRLFERLFICGPQRRTGRTLHNAIRRARAHAQLGGFNLGWQALSVAF